MLNTVLKYSASQPFLSEAVEVRWDTTHEASLNQVLDNEPIPHLYCKACHSHQWKYSEIFILTEGFFKKKKLSQNIKDINLSSLSFNKVHTFRNHKQKSQ